MRIPPLLVLAPFGAALLGACSTGIFSTAEEESCEKALEVLVEGGPDKSRFEVGDAAQGQRTLGGRRVTGVTLTYIQSNTRKLVSCYFKPGTTVAAGYVFEGRRLTDAATAAVNRRL